MYKKNIKKFLSSQVKTSHFASHIYVPVFNLVSFCCNQMQCFSLLCDFVNALQEYEKNVTDEAAQS